MDYRPYCSSSLSPQQTPKMSVTVAVMLDPEDLAIQAQGEQHMTGLVGQLTQVRAAHATEDQAGPGIADLEGQTTPGQVEQDILAQAVQPTTDQEVRPTAVLEALAIAARGDHATQDLVEAVDAHLCADDVEKISN